MVSGSAKNNKLTLEQERISSVAQAVLEGLSGTSKQLPSWLFYDENGDRIFQTIMRMPEYYPTPCEYEILQSNKEELRRYFQAMEPFHLVEFGAGDGWKTEVLLRHFLQAGNLFSYMPVDISAGVLNTLTSRLERTLPGLSVAPLHYANEQALAHLPMKLGRRVFMFLGANIGNYTVPEANAFGQKVAQAMTDDDLLMIGFDLKKDAEVIRVAYDDPKGITRDFNLNLLVRLNRELGANFQKDKFAHVPFYDPETGAAKSYLLSREPQDVYVEYLDRTFHFDAWETIHTEISMKYDEAMISEFAAEAGLEIVETFFDRKKYFCDVLFRTIQS